MLASKHQKLSLSTPCSSANPIGTNTELPTCTGHTTCINAKTWGEKGEAQAERGEKKDSFRNENRDQITRVAIPVSVKINLDNQ